MKMMVILLVVLCFSHSLFLRANAANYHPKSTLELSAGYSISPRNVILFRTAYRYGLTTGFNNSFFVPILSSASFNYHNSSQSPGFSLGFLFVPTPASDVYGIYLALCGGIAGDLDSQGGTISTAKGIKDSASDYLSIYTPHYGYAVPVWIANPSTPLTSLNASLMVVSVEDTQLGGSNTTTTTTTTKQLQLTDYNGRVLWKVSNVGLMEMQDTGTLTIYNSSDRTNVVWQSGPRDTLFVGEKLTVGKQLTSGDSSYSARMEKGGLVLYANSLQFNMEARPTPAYWAIPALLSLQDNPFNVNNKVMSSPCSGPNDRTAYAVINPASSLFLIPGPCTDTDSNLEVIREDRIQVGPLSFVKLENDGWLHSYAVSEALSTGDPLTVVPFWNYLYGSTYAEPILQFSFWNSCFVPLACGPLGVCTPYASSPCSCPAVPSFQPMDSDNLPKGCTRVKALPNCSKSEHVGTTQFIQLNHTASIFLFSGLEPLSSCVQDMQTCKTACSSNCSCNGFFYQANISTCFFITHEMSLLNLTSDIISNSTNYPNVDGTVRWQVDVLKRDYVTYLKVIHDQASPTTGLARSTVIAITVVSSFAACVGLGVAILLLYARETKRRLLRKQAKQAAIEEEELREVLPLLPSRFSYQDLHEATNGFSKLLGAGGCGSVYAGVLRDGRKVAVKTLDFVMKGQLSKQFLAEVATIGRTSHHNIVRLVGFCWEVSNRLLVYEYMERGSLDHWLFHKTCDDEGAPLLDWQARYNVVLGIVRGLHYLHEECPQPILHFDIKPQNILLDGAFVAKLADFGMSRLIQRDVSQVVTGVRGTPGYIAPEWLTHGAVSKKSDIYSMGMVILEMVGGRKILDLELLNKVSNATDCHNDTSTSGSGQHEEWHFPSWAARRCEEGLEIELVDKRLRGAFNEEQARRLIYTAFWCIQEDAGTRPYVPTVLKWLEGSSPVKQPPFSSATHSKLSSSSSS